MGHAHQYLYTYPNRASPTSRVNMSTPSLIELLGYESIETKTRRGKSRILRHYIEDCVIASYRDLAPL